MEKLNLWDRLFNRHKTTIVEQGSENWNRRCQWTGVKLGEGYSRDFVIYKHIDRVTGSETIEKKYLN
jgi:hypothetical protein